MADDAVGILFDLLAYVEAKGDILGHTGGKLREHHQVGVGNSECRVAEGLAIEADGLKQIASIGTRRDRIGNLAYGTSENCGRSRNAAAPWRKCCPDTFQARFDQKLLAQSIIVQGGSPVLASVPLHEPRGRPFIGTLVSGG